MRDTIVNSYAIRFIFLCLLMLGASALPSLSFAESGAEAKEEEPEKGPHRGRMWRDGGFAIELAIFETGVPPEFRVWITHDNKPVAPQEVDLRIKLTRLGNVVDDIGFKVEGDYLRGDTVIYEPHSFVVTIVAKFQGQTFQWEYDNFEGRTRIADNVADAMDIVTEKAGEATLHQTIRVYGRLVLPPNAKRKIQARFDGEIKKIDFDLGDKVKQGQVLATIESNESLKTYQITAPMDGVVSKQFANTGEQTAGRTLLEITRTDKLLAELAVYPADSGNVRNSAPVTLSFPGLDEPATSKISGLKTALRADQAKLFFAEVSNTEGLLNEGLFVTSDIEVEIFTVPLAVKRTGLQAFRDFTVVYSKFGEEYEVRMLELGREAGPWVEVLGGLEPGTEYVTENSYIIKADIEKSGASHDH